MPHVATLTSMRPQQGEITFVNIILVLHTEGCMLVDIAFNFKKISYIYRKLGCILRLFPHGNDFLFVLNVYFLNQKSFFSRVGSYCK